MKLDKVIAVRNNKTVYRDGDLCMKVFSSDFSKADILNEALNQARVEETGLKIPKLREITVLNGKWAIISDYIKGKTLAQLIAENPGKKNEYINTLVDLQLEVHKKSCPLLGKLKEKINSQLSRTDFDKAIRYELNSRLEGMPKHNKLCHGDFVPENIILSDDGEFYIIDWAHAAQGNASADAARTYLLFWLDGDIDGAKKYLELFCEKSNTEMQYVQKWMPLVAASQTTRCRSNEREFLNSWVNVAEYE